MDSEAPLQRESLVQKAAILGGSVLIILLLASVFSDPMTQLQTDWTAFDNAASRLFAGETVYQPWNAETEPLPYLYPPFVLWLALPLALTGFLGSWAISFAMTAGTLAIGVALLSKTMPAGVDRTTGLVLAGSCGMFFGAALLGQYSGMYVFSLGLALWLWHKDRVFLAGLALAILWMKPNFAIAVPVVLIWARSWPALRGFFAGGVVAIVASVPFGLGLWADAYLNVLDMGQRQRAGQLFESKFVSVLGGFQALTGAELLDPASVAVFLVVALVVGVATLVAWHPSKLIGNLDRAFGMLAIFVVVANTRVYFYDGAVAVFGVLALWFHAQRTGNVHAKKWISRLAVPLWIFSWGIAFDSVNAYFGIVASAIALSVAWSAVKERAETTSTPEDLSCLVTLSD